MKISIREDWQVIIKKAWSIKLIFFAVVFSIMEIILPMFAHTMKEGLFSTLSVLAMVAAFIARLVAQKDVK